MKKIKKTIIKIAVRIKLLTKEEIIYAILSGIFISASIFIIFLIARQEKEKGTLEKQMESAQQKKTIPAGAQNNSAIDIKNKEDAQKSVESMDNLMNSIGNTDEENNN